MQKFDPCKFFAGLHTYKDQNGHHVKAAMLRKSCRRLHETRGFPDGLGDFSETSRRTNKYLRNRALKSAFLRFSGAGIIAKHTLGPSIIVPPLLVSCTDLYVSFGPLCFVQVVF